MEMSAALTSRPLTEESDWDLVVAVKNGEDRAFEIVVNRYKARILSLTFRITRNHEDAQDVTQQSFQNASVKEVGQCLGVRNPTVKARLFRGRQKVSQLFKRYVEYPRRRVSSNLENVA